MKNDLDSLDEWADELLKKSEGRSLSFAAKPNKHKKKGDKLAGAKRVTLQSGNFDLILNILIGIRRSVSTLTEIPGKALDAYEY